MAEGGSAAAQPMEMSEETLGQIIKKLKLPEFRPTRLRWVDNSAAYDMETERMKKAIINIIDGNTCPTCKDGVCQCDEPAPEARVEGGVVTPEGWYAQQEWEDETLAMIASAYPDGNPKTAFGEAKVKLSDTPTIGIQLMGQVHSNGANKYGRFNWREHMVSSTVYYDAAQRHLMAWFNGETIDPESGLPHLAHVMACCNILLDAEENGKLNDNRLK